MTNYQYTKDFMRAFKQEVPSWVIEPTINVRKMRARLILEEALETIEAMGLAPRTIKGEFLIADEVKHYTYVNEKHPELDKVLDSIVDLDVVNKGTAIAFGFSEELLQKAEKAVYESNMSKLWSYRSSKPEHTSSFCFYDNGNPRFIVTDATGKVIKPPTYKVPDIKKLIFIDENNPHTSQ